MLARAMSALGCPSLPTTARFPTLLRRFEIDCQNVWQMRRAGARTSDKVCRPGGHHVFVVVVPARIENDKAGFLVLCRALSSLPPIRRSRRYRRPPGNPALGSRSKQW